MTRNPKAEAPERLYLEVWPEECDRQTAVHLEQAGYGIDMATGASSTIHVYIRADLVEAKTPRHAKRKR